MKTVANDFKTFKQLFIQMDESKIQEEVMINYKDQNDSSSNYAQENRPLPVDIESLRETRLSGLRRGEEIAPYDNSDPMNPTLEGLTITIKREFFNKVVVGCKEFKEFHQIIDEDLNNYSCYEFIDMYLSIISYRMAA